MNLCGRMSRGHCQPKTQPARSTLGRCNSKSKNNVIIIDVDRSKIDVIVVDAPESSNRRSRHSGASLNLNKMCSPSNVISIDDEGDDDDDGFMDGDQNAASSKTYHPTSKKYFSEESDSDECQVLAGKEFYSESPKCMFDNHSSECSTSESDTSDCDVSESDIFETTDSNSDSDCEIMDDSSVNFREEWEKAALKKKMERSHDPSKEGLGAFGSHNEPGTPMCETPQKKDDFMTTSGGTHAVPNNDKVHSNASISINGKEELPHVPDIVDGFTEESLPNFKKKYSADDLDHRVGEGIHGRPSSQNKSESLSENLHTAQSQSEFSFDYKLKSNACGQDAPAPSSFSYDTWMQHGLHGRSDKFSPIHSEDVSESAVLFTAGIPDKHQDEDLLRHGSSSPCNTHCPSQHVPESQSRKVTDVAEDSPSFHAQAKPASSELNVGLGEMHTEMGVDHSFGEEEAVLQGPLGNSIQEDMNPRMIEQSSLENVNVMSDIRNNIIGEWEKHKESEEYRLAEEEEWASRRQQLQVQAEEIQKLRKRKKAENLRLLDMEKRQKQRVEEMRESQKREEEAINLKDQLRSEIRKELEKLEMKYRDMASLLRGLGVNVSGGLYPMPHEVNAAYRQALLRFHPDRASRTDIRRQVEAEEKFKLISRLKDKLFPIAY